MLKLCIWVFLLLIWDSVPELACNEQAYLQLRQTMCLYKRWTVLESIFNICLLRMYLNWSPSLLEVVSYTHFSMMSWLWMMDWLVLVLDLLTSFLLVCYALTLKCQTFLLSLSHSLCLREYNINQFKQYIIYTVSQWILMNIPSSLCFIYVIEYKKAYQHCSSDYFLCWHKVYSHLDGTDYWNQQSRLWFSVIFLCWSATLWHNWEL